MKPLTQESKPTGGTQEPHPKREKIEPNKPHPWIFAGCPANTIAVTTSKEEERKQNPPEGIAGDDDGLVVVAVAVDGERMPPRHG